ncbi:arylamine N-acetyltransferase family protein [Streptomyces pactum]|uniref:arylamine N-acetyltransferase family protein n=1 Tax=Streptomyces pactum TaxID=68249 RepID=UPI0036FEDC8D
MTDAPDTKTSTPASPAGTAGTAPHSASPLDLDAYLARTGWSGERRATVETLRSLHRAHLEAIPFENLQPLLDTAPSLALPDLQDKLVRSRRGGYCFEQNTLFTAVLEAFGFRVTRFAARVVLGAGPGDVRPRTHMTLAVQVPAAAPGDPVRTYLADVGYGSVGGLYEAIPLVADVEVADGVRSHRLIRRPHHGPSDLWTLQARQGGVWTDQYTFTEEPFEHPDFEVFNWHVGTNPRSPFRYGLIAQRTFPTRHLALHNRTVVETREDGSAEERRLGDDEDLVAVLARDFGIELPPGTRFPTDLTGA